MVEEGIMLIRITRRLTYSDKLRKYSAKQRKSLENLINQASKDFCNSADEGTRTPTGVCPADFESASSAIPTHPHQ